MKLRQLRQTGDTIVEVLIALTVVASMLGAAYATSNRSLIGNRQAQERSEALKLAEGQLERLKAVVNTGSTDPYTVASTFCLDSANKVKAATPAECTVDSGGPQYYVTVERQPDDKFAIAVSWDKAGGNGSDVINMDYRLHPANNNFLIPETDPDAPTTPGNPQPPTTPMPPTGSLECRVLGTTSTSLVFSSSNATKPTLFRGDQPVSGASTSPATDTGLTPGTGYVYYLRNTDDPKSTSLAMASCTTASNASGTLECTVIPLGGINLNYSYSAASSPSIWRENTYIYNATDGAGSFVDSDSEVMNKSNKFTYYLRNGQSSSSPVLATASCGGQGLPPGPICLKGGC